MTKILIHSALFISLIGTPFSFGQDKRLDDYPVILAGFVWFAVDLKQLDCSLAYRVTVREINAPIVSFIILDQVDRQKIVWRSVSGTDSLSRVAITAPEKLDPGLEKLTKRIGSVFESLDKAKPKGEPGIDGYTFHLERYDHNKKRSDVFTWRTDEIGGKDDTADTEGFIASIWNAIVDADDALPESCRIEIQQPDPAERE